MAASVALAVFAIVSTMLVGAAAYLVFRDDLLGSSLSRQVALQHSYEERIAALRGEIDRLASRQGVAAAGVEAQVALLLDRQTEIAARQIALDGLVDTAMASGVRLARDTIDAAPARAPAPHSPADAPLTYAPIETTHSGRERELELVEASLASARNRQDATLQTLERASENRLGALSAALSPLGVDPRGSNNSEPQGGPFIAATGLHFVERTAVLEQALADIDNLRRTADALPLRAPLFAARVSSRFGYRDDPFLSRRALHAGIDYAAAEGVGVRATASGTVVSAGWSGGYGQMVEVRHALGVTTRYGHLSTLLVRPGMPVAAGALIGRVGSTGRSTGPHLHYETRRNGEPVNPALYLAAGRKAAL